MGGPYNIPRNYKGEGKILFIFSTKSFLYTGAGLIIGIIFYFLFSALALKTVGLVILIALAGLGFVIGTFKIPDNSNFKFTQKTGGEAIDQVIIRWIKFKRNKRKIYVYKEEER